MNERKYLLSPYGGEYYVNITSTLEALMSRTTPIVFVVDDDVSVRESLELLIRNAGWQPELFESAQEFLVRPRALVPSCLVLDIGLPVMDGYEVARRIRACPWGRDMMLVALTGWGQDSDRKCSSEAGFNAHWVKPLELDRLWSLLESLPAATQAAARSGTN